MRATPCSSGMAQAAMIFPATIHAGVRATLVAGQGQVAEAARHDILPPEPRNVPVSHVEAVQRSFRETGFLRKCPRHLSRRIGPARIRYMRPSGEYTLVDVSEGRVIHALYSKPSFRVLLLSVRRSPVAPLP